MKKKSAIFWNIVGWYLVIGVSFFATPSQASNMNYVMNQHRCGIGQRQGDRILGVWLSHISGKVMSFTIDLSMDASHLSGTDGIVRQSSFSGLNVAIFPYDGQGNSLSKSYTVGHAAPTRGNARATMNSTLVNAYSISPVSKFLVVAWEATWEGIGFCKVLNNSDVSRQAAPPLAPAAPPLTPAAPRTQTGPPQGPGYGYASAPAASIQACSELNHANPNNRCVGLGGGRNGFWRQAPWILINFKPLAPSSHTLTVYYTGKNRNGAWIQTRHWNKTFNNTSTNWEVWFRSPLTVGDDCLPCNLSFVLDGRNVGAINLEGSFE